MLGLLQCNTRPEQVSVRLSASTFLFLWVMGIIIVATLLVFFEDSMRCASKALGTLPVVVLDN